MATTTGGQPETFSDVMLAMDVVDTLRHQQVLIDRELNAEDRDQRMLDRLREIYASQGIEVPDTVLQQGVDALREDRFSYTPPASSLQTRLATWYIERDRWGKPLLLCIAVLVGLTLFYWLAVQRPAQLQASALPSQIEQIASRLDASAQGDQAREAVATLQMQADAALQDGDTETQQRILAEMQALQRDIQRQYEIRVVSRPGVNSGVWRIPDVNTNARNYYLIVEAVDEQGKAVNRKVVNEEDGKSYQVSTWGLRVEESTFNAFAADKRDDGIIQQSKVGTKRRGYLVPSYLVQTSGAAITSW